MKSQKGQSLVETALIIPVILILLFGIVDFGRIFHAYLTLDHAGREAARTAIVGAEDSEIISRIRSASHGLDIHVAQLTEKANRISGNEVVIELTYQVDFITPIIGQFIDPFPLENTTTMRME